VFGTLQRLLPNWGDTQLVNSALGTVAVSSWTTSPRFIMNVCFSPGVIASTFFPALTWALEVKVTEVLSCVAVMATRPGSWVMSVS
jgi:hypothetical protein